MLNRGVARRACSAASLSLPMSLPLSLLGAHGRTRRCQSQGRCGGRACVPLSLSLSPACGAAEPAPRPLSPASLPPPPPRCATSLARPPWPPLRCAPPSALAGQLAAAGVWCVREEGQRTTLGAHGRDEQWRTRLGNRCGDLSVTVLFTCLLPGVGGQVRGGPRWPCSSALPWATCGQWLVIWRASTASF